MLDPNLKTDKIINPSFSVFLYSVPPVRVRTTTYTSAYSMRLCYQDYPQVWYCWEGEYFHETEFGEYRCGPGTVLTVSPGVLHHVTVPGEGEVTLTQLDLSVDYLENVSFEDAANTAANLFLPPFLRQSGIACPEFFRLSEPTRAVMEEELLALSRSEMEEPAKRAAVERIFSQPEFALQAEEKKRAADAARTKFYPVMRALSYMHANYPRKITAEQLCEASSLCRTNFFTLIKQYLGISYTAYLTMIRIFRATFALVHTNYSLAYISDMCGFADCSHMSKCYMKYKGILPKEDRAKQKQYQEKYGKLHITHEYFLDDFFE